MHVGDDCVKKAAVKQMHSQFDRTLFWESVSVEDFALCLNRMVATLATLGEVVKEYLVVKKILHCVPPHMK
jgi:primosomal protein N''